MATTLETLIALHVPERAKAEALIKALGIVTGAAETNAEDWETGMADGTYDSDPRARAEFAKLQAALILLEE